jgi:hypothetical protein
MMAQRVIIASSPYRFESSYPTKEERMTRKPETDSNTDSLKCPTCRTALKQRRSRKADQCELVCGGCGEIFDVCDLDTVDRIKKIK